MIIENIDRHIVVIETPENSYIGRGDVEMAFQYGGIFTTIDVASFTHAGTIEEDGETIILDKGKVWKRGYDYVWGPTNIADKLEQNNRMIEAMHTAIKIMQKENSKIRGEMPNRLDHYALNETKLRTD